MRFSICQIMRIPIPWRVVFAVAAPVYLLIGLIMTITIGGCASVPIAMTNRMLRAPYQEFLHAKAETSTIGTICKLNTPTVSSDDKVITFGGSVVVDEQGKPKDIWVFPFAVANDAVCFHMVAGDSATIEYFAQKPAVALVPNRPAKLIYIDEPWPEIRLKDELKSLEESGRYGFYIYPSEPTEHKATIIIHGFGAHSDYHAKVSNPEHLPYLNRSRGKIWANSLNYIWAVPLDSAIMPIVYPAFQLWWHNFVRF